MAADLLSRGFRASAPGSRDGVGSQGRPKSVRAKSVEYPRGDGGFGYDAIWCPDGYAGMTRAELSDKDEQVTYEAGRPLEQIRRFLNE